MKYPHSLALICACLCCVADSYPQFQCDSGTQLLTTDSKMFYNRYIFGDWKTICDINKCNWKWGWILKDTDDVNNADCEDCPFGDGDIFERDVPQENAQNLWICPRHCHAMPQINMQVTLETGKVTWSRRWARVGESFRSPYDGLHKSPGPAYQFQVADRSSVSTTGPETLSVILPGATCESGGRNCHRFQKRSDSEDDVADTNVYSLRSPESCLNHRYGSNWNERILSCRQWKPPGGEFPYMVHFNDNFWPAEPTNIHNFDSEQKGWKSNQKTISQCPEVGFKTTPCWLEGATSNLIFSVKPFYTAYRNHNPKGDKTSCRMVVHGPVNTDDSKWSQTYFENPTIDSEWKAATYWESIPYTAYHEYYRRSGPEFYNLVKAVRPDFYKTNKGEVKKYHYNFQCMNGNTPGPSGDALYYHSGCKSIQCIDFMTKPCYDNVYRFDDMVCKLVTDGFNTAMSFQKFVDKTVPEQRYRDAFMSYGRYPRSGPSYFQMTFDNSKIDVIKDGYWSVQPNQAIDFLPHSTILVTTKSLFSCSGCREKPLHGRANINEVVLLHYIIQCRKCMPYEKTLLGYNFQDCKPCARHQVRNPDDAVECRKCQEIDALTPMRRTSPLDTQCTTCQHFQYFNENTEQGCQFLKTVTDGIQVVGGKAKLLDVDQYIRDEIRKDIPERFWRDNIQPTAPWNRELVPRACAPSYVKPTTNVPRIEFTAWCGHHEMVRHQQAWLRLRGGMLYLPLNSDQALTRISTSVVELCGGSPLVQVQGSTSVDLTCGQGQYNFSIIRGGFQDPCTRCFGAKFTDKCWPTYVPGLEVYDEQYFLPSNKALKPQPGTCSDCNPRCHNMLQPDHFIDPVEYSCWWDGTGRIPGVLGSTATNFSWYKPAPCTKCSNVRLTDNKAELVLACGNRVSYRRWLSDTVSGSEDDPTRSIPSIQICCVEKRASATSTCTDTPAEFENFVRDSCNQVVDDTPPVFLPYCPSGWYVEPTCAKDSPIWNPDCCVKCKACRGGKFKLDAYYDCPGNEYFDSQDRGCTTKCLTNQYLRNERCIKCEACE